MTAGREEDPLRLTAALWARTSLSTPAAPAIALCTPGGALLATKAQLPRVIPAPCRNLARLCTQDTDMHAVLRICNTHAQHGLVPLVRHILALHTVRVACRRPVGRRPKPWQCYLSIRAAKQRTARSSSAPVSARLWPSPPATAATGTPASTPDRSRQGARTSA